MNPYATSPVGGRHFPLNGAIPKRHRPVVATQFLPRAARKGGDRLSGADELRRENEALRERISTLSAAVLRVSASLDVDTVLHEGIKSTRALTGARYGVIITTTADDAGLVPEEKVADEHVPVAHRRALHGLRRQQVRGETERTDGVHVRESQWFRQVPQVLEEARRLGPVDQLPVLVRREAGADELPGSTRMGGSLRTRAKGSWCFLPPPRRAAIGTSIGIFRDRKKRAPRCRGRRIRANVSRRELSTRGGSPSTA